MMNKIKKIIYFLIIILFSSCTQDKIESKLNTKKNELLKIDTQILKSLNDSLNTTGNYKYYEKYIRKIDEMIIKYPEQKQLLKVRENMKEIFEE